MAFALHSRPIGVARTQISSIGFTACMVAESRRRYPMACDAYDPLVMCVSHAKRMLINERQNARLAPEGATFLEWEGEDLAGTTMQPQSMRVWIGLEHRLLTWIRHKTDGSGCSLRDHGHHQDSLGSTDAR